MLVLLALALAADTAAAAAKPPRVRVTVEATSEVTWSVNAPGSCTSSSGNGSETSTYRISQIVPLAALKNPMRSGLKLHATSTRTGTFTETFAGSCAAGPACFPSDWASAVAHMNVTVAVPCSGFTTPTTDCGTKSITVPAGSGLYLGWGGDNATSLTIQLMVEKPIWGTCAGHIRHPQGVAAIGGYDFANIPFSALLTKKTVVVSGSHSGPRCGISGCPPALPEAPETLHDTWLVKFERVR